MYTKETGNSNGEAARSPERLVPQFERRWALAAKSFPSHAIEKVLIRNQDVEIPERVRASFDHLLTAEEVFGDA